MMVKYSWNIPDRKNTVLLESKKEYKSTGLIHRSSHCREQDGRSRISTANR